MPPQTFAKKKMSSTYHTQSHLLIHYYLNKNQIQLLQMNHQPTLPKSEKATGAAVSLENPLQ